MIFVFVITRSHRPEDIIAHEAALMWTQRAVGGIIAAIAAFALLLRGLAGETMERQVGLVLPLLGGVMLAGAHWSVALATGAVCVAFLYEGRFAGRLNNPFALSRFGRPQVHDGGAAASEDEAKGQ
jgi:hypothetical protein